MGQTHRRGDEAPTNLSAQAYAHTPFFKILREMHSDAFVFRVSVSPRGTNEVEKVGQTPSGVHQNRIKQAVNSLYMSELSVFQSKKKMSKTLVLHFEELGSEL